MLSPSACAWHATVLYPPCGDNTQCHPWRWGTPPHTLHPPYTPYIQAIGGAIESFLADLHSGSGAPRDLYVDFNALTLRIALQALFGASMQAAAASTITCTLLAGPCTLHL